MKLLCSYYCIQYVVLLLKIESVYLAFAFAVVFLFVRIRKCFILPYSFLKALIIETILRSTGRRVECVQAAAEWSCCSPLLYPMFCLNTEMILINLFHLVPEFLQPQKVSGLRSKASTLHAPA